MQRLATALNALGFLWACAATIYLVGGAGSRTMSTSSALGEVEGVGHVTVPLLSDKGPWVVGLLVGITLLSGVPLGVALRHPPGHQITTFVASGLVLGFALIAGFSVGIPYLPVAAALLAAGLVRAHDIRPGSSGASGAPDAP